MSYCSRLYIVEKSRVIEDFGKRYAEKIAMLDMGQIPELSDILQKQKETDCFIYADDGDTMILEDCYGEPLTESSIDTVIEALKSANANNDYRRIEPALGMLNTFLLQQKRGRWVDLVVLHYGY